MSKSTNKYNCTNALELQHVDQRVIHAESDADVPIIQTAKQMARYFASSS